MVLNLGDLPESAPGAEEHEGSSVSGMIVIEAGDSDIPVELGFMPQAVIVYHDNGGGGLDSMAEFYTNETLWKEGSWVQILGTDGAGHPHVVGTVPYNDFRLELTNRGLTVHANINPNLGAGDTIHFVAIR